MAPRLWRHHSRAGRNVLRSRQGYTLAEMVIVVVMVGMLSIFAIPKFTVIAESNKITAAREEIAAAIATARAAAVQKGRTATLWFSSNQMWVTVVTSNAGATTTVVPLKSFTTLYNVSVTPPASSITFDMRGFLSPRLPAPMGVFRIVGRARRDSVCVTPVGQIMPRGCSL